MKVINYNDCKALNKTSDLRFLHERLCYKLEGHGLES
jgi:hypothetical protein